MVLISGEPGIGKSRLTAALSEHIGTEPHTRLRYFCSPHHQDSALHPFIAQLERAAGFTRDDSVEAKLGKLRAVLAPGARDDDDIALLSELLSLPSPAADLNLSSQRKREKLFEALLSQLEAEARHRPVLTVFEDAHWIDPTSREAANLRDRGAVAFLPAGERPQLSGQHRPPSSLASVRCAPFEPRRACGEPIARESFRQRSLSSLNRGPRRANASGSARSRVRFVKTCST